MRKKQPEPSNLELAQRIIGAEYTPISQEHNAMKLLLEDLGKDGLSPQEVEELCQTAKVPGINGFVRLDSLPCGCVRIYRGMVMGVERTLPNVSIRIGGLEGVKPCPRHVDLVRGIQMPEVVEQPRMF